MLRKALICSLFVTTVVFAALAWPVNAAYSSDCDGCNSGSIQNMGYHNIWKVGKVYKIKFSNNTVAYFLYVSKYSSLKFREVGLSEYGDDPGDDPAEPERPGARAEFASCNGSVPSYANTWWETSANEMPIDSFQVQTLVGSSWQAYFDGGEMCVLFSSSNDTSFRVRTINFVGASLWKYYSASHDCSGPGGGGSAN